MKTILFLALLTLFGFTSKQPPSEDCLRLDVILIGDTSDSVIGYESFIDTAFTSFVDKFEMADQSIRMGVIQFSDDAHVLCHLTGDKQIVKKSLNKFKEKANGSTNMLAAFWAAVREFKTNGRLDVKKVIVIVSDGEPSSIIETTSVATHLKDTLGIDICGVLVVKIDNDDGSFQMMYNVRDSYSPQFMKNISSDFCYVESDFKTLKNKLMRLSICL